MVRSPAAQTPLPITHLGAPRRKHELQPTIGAFTPARPRQEPFLMALHPDFPRSPYEVLPPDQRWFPAAEERRDTAYEKLLPPLVAKVRDEVRQWRDAGYAGALEDRKSTRLNSSH